MKKIILVFAVLFVGLLSTTNLRAQGTEVNLYDIEDDTTIISFSSGGRLYEMMFLTKIDESTLRFYVDVSEGFDGIYNWELNGEPLIDINSNSAVDIDLDTIINGATITVKQISTGDNIPNNETFWVLTYIEPQSIINSIFDSLNALGVAFIAITVSLFTNIAGVFYDPITGINWFTTLLILPVALTFTYYAFGFITRLLKRLF